MSEMMKAADLINAFSDISLEEKKICIEMWTEVYYQVKGKMPERYELVKLADWLLADELKDKSRSKVQKKEYPILSKSQIERRFRELSMEQELVDSLHRRKSNHLPTRKKDAKHNEY